MKPNRYQKMTKKQIKEIVAEYAAHFPEWTPYADGAAFVRESGPVRQMIWFQALRTGDYRPTHGISSLVLPEAYIRMLPQMLDVRNRESNLKQHASRMPGMLAAMEQQFRPDVRKPLDITDVLALCEAEAGTMQDTTNNMTMLAILSTWLGRDAEALGYCERMQHCSPPMLAPMPEWEDAMRTFGRELAGAIESGHGKAFLEDAIAGNPSE
ncbi:hypothetical protein [Pelagerythrobacter marensis]|uniref:Uncharacterized protein n=1 Tax=Pelagerythrobacter marensis TaxID=543877 RepID=A0A0G3XBE1_9SPHN|nr:hypothetical protein [Pelagerythrobacter marensis]AKM07956.1 hypothetical protein AM2010_1894 [Pelagerythrobacter marensis]